MERREVPSTIRKVTARITMTMNSDALVKDTAVRWSENIGTMMNWWIGSIACSGAATVTSSSAVHAQACVDHVLARRRWELSASAGFRGEPVDVPETRRRPQHEEDDQAEWRGAEPGVDLPADEAADDDTRDELGQDAEAEAHRLTGAGHARTFVHR